MVSRLALTTTNGEVLSQMIGNFGLGISLAFPVSQVYFLTKPIDDLSEPKFKSKFGYFFSDVRNISKTSLAYSLVYMVRRFMFVAVSAWGDEIVIF